MSDEVTELFEARAESYAHDGWHARYARGLVRTVPLAPEDLVLDAGAGTGAATEAVASRLGPRGRVIGVDLSAGMLHRLRTGSAGPAIDRVVADATALPFPDHTFDVVISSASLLYMPVTRALADWFRVLRPGGRLAFSAMGEGQPPGAALFADLARGRGLVLTASPAGPRTEADCVATLTAAGFTDVTVCHDIVRFDQADLDDAWPVHARIHRREFDTLTPAALRAFESDYRAVMTARHDEVSVARVLYAHAIRG